MIGSIEWFKDTEKHYGGFHKNVPRLRVSEHDPRSKENLKIGGMKGGDRMSRHGYAPHYSHHLQNFLQDRMKAYTIIECGILKGTGLAIWNSLFPNAEIIGLDIDLTHTKNNLDNLKQRGAFKTGNLELYEFDQFKKNKDMLSDILKGRTVDVAIDDGFHSEETITNTLDDLIPLLSKKFVYFIEDNPTIHSKIEKEYNQYKVSKYNKFVVINDE
jgi:hypothetical protein